MGKRERKASVIDLYATQYGMSKEEAEADLADMFFSGTMNKELKVFNTLRMTKAGLSNSQYETVREELGRMMTMGII